MSEGQEVLKQLNRSGFPFQLRVEHEVQSSTHIHRWSVATREHPWVNPETGASGFADIVLKHDVFVTFRAVLECKRMKADDARQLRWLFLLPKDAKDTVKRASCLEVEGEERDGEWRDIRIWEDVVITPASPESEFCVLPNDEQRRQPILEGLAADVLESVEGVAQEEVRIAQSQGKHGHVPLFIVPVIVTNAEIVACRFHPEDIDLRDGTLEAPKVTRTAVPFIRFRKSLATSLPEGRRFNDLEGAQRARQRSIFIVNAESISQFLEGWAIQAGSHDGRFAIQRHQLWT